MKTYDVSRMRCAKTKLGLFVFLADEIVYSDLVSTWRYFF